MAAYKSTRTTQMQETYAPQTHDTDYLNGESQWNLACLNKDNELFIYQLFLFTPQLSAPFAHTLSIFNIDTCTHPASFWQGPPCLPPVNSYQIHWIKIEWRLGISEMRDYVIFQKQSFKVFFYEFFMHIFLILERLSKPF